MKIASRTIKIVLACSLAVALPLAIEIVFSIHARLDNESVMRQKVLHWNAILAEERRQNPTFTCGAELMAIGYRDTMSDLQCRHDKQICVLNLGSAVFIDNYRASCQTLPEGVETCNAYLSTFPKDEDGPNGCHGTKLSGLTVIWAAP